MFIHLRLHTEYSVSEGLLRMKSLGKELANRLMPAAAVTDISNLYGMVKFYGGAINNGVKPIIAAEVWLEDETTSTNPNDKQYTKIVFLAKNQIGYANLVEILSKSFLEGQKLGVPLVSFDWLETYNEGLIALSGANDSQIARLLVAERYDAAKEILIKWQDIYGEDFFLELQRLGRPDEDSYIHSAVKLALETNTSVVATNNVCFLEESDYEAHEARVCINRGMSLKDMAQSSGYTTEQYLKTSEQMEELFADIPSAITNTVNIAKKCNVEVELGNIHLPNFPVPEGFTTEQYLEQVSNEGMRARLKHLKHVFPEQEFHVDEYQERLDIELKVINEMGFAGYFLIVSDFIKWAKTHEILVGPGRGSGAGSLVAYSLEITNLDPLHYDLLFERFLNPERVSMPDFDIDFCMENRDRVIDYVAEKYGRESVSQIITFGTMAAKAVVRDVGRALGHPYGFVDKIAKLIPFEIGITLEKAIEQEEALAARYQEEEEVRILIDLARKLEGVVRNVGKHAGGVVIAPSKLTDFSPLYAEESSQSTVTQFDKDDVESIGLVKFDFLGLRTLTIIHWAIDSINHEKKKLGEPLIDIDSIPVDCAKTFDLLKACKTAAVFQLESRGMTDLVAKLQPDKLEDIIALVALFRPGPLQSGMVDDFINRKHGRAKVEYPHIMLESILKPTYGIILYQEQVMQIAQVLAGYTLGGADILRRAMGKKKPEEMAKQRVVFTDGAEKNNIKRETAEYIFDLIEKFAGYGFNKSHSAAYGLISYQTAWLKAHYKAAFMAAVLSSDMNQTDKIVSMIAECKKIEIEVLPPDVNDGIYKFKETSDSTIRYGLGALKGLGEAAIINIIETRDKIGKFSSLSHFCKTVDLKKVNRRSMEALIKSGAMDSFKVERKVLFEVLLAKALSEAEQQAKNAKLGQDDLFSEVLDDVEDDAVLLKLPKGMAWTEQERPLGEKDSLGLYLTGHPINQYRKELERFTSSTLAELTGEQKKVTVAGLITDLKTMITKRGKKMAFLGIDDGTARVEVAVFSDAYEEAKEFLLKDQLIILKGEASIDNYTQSVKIKTEKLLSINMAREKYAQSLHLSFVGDINLSVLNKIKKLIEEADEGPSYVAIHHKNEKIITKLALERKIRLEDSLITGLKLAIGEDAVSLEY